MGPLDEIPLKGPVIQYEGWIVEHVLRNSDLSLLKMKLDLIFIRFFNPCWAQIGPDHT